jgi:2-polyprenyl-3-methyl-5-hydroxy-6-metoxy-1,4-benzoquinol methylase
VDRDKVDAFLDRFIELASGATTIGLLAVADRSGLSRHLGETGGGTASELAQGAGLNARYVEEIMSGLAAAGVVDYDPGERRFELPPEHALFLSVESSPYFMGGFLDIIPVFLGQIDGVATATRDGGGVGFEEYGDAVVKAIARAQTASQTTFLVSRWLPAVPGLVSRMESGIRVADVGCGSGTAAILMARAFPDSDVTGFDVSALSIETAIDRAAGLDNVDFSQRSVEEMPTDPPFDLITAFDVIHDLADPLAGLRRIRDALAAAGAFLMMEPNASSHLEDNLTPRGAMLYGTSTLHCLTQSLAQGGAGLGAAWGKERAGEMAEEAGFTSFQALDDITNKFSAFYLLT